MPDDETIPGNPEEVAAAARRMLGEMAAADESRPECSIETAVQLREALREVKTQEGAVMDCDSLDRLPFAVRRYVETQERASAALHAASRETGVEQVAVEPRPLVTTRG